MLYATLQYIKKLYCVFVKTARQKSANFHVWLGIFNHYQIFLFNLQWPKYKQSFFKIPIFVKVL